MAFVAITASIFAANAAMSSANAARMSSNTYGSYGRYGSSYDSPYGSRYGSRYGSGSGHRSGYGRYGHSSSPFDDSYNVDFHRPAFAATSYDDGDDDKETMAASDDGKSTAKPAAAADSGLAPPARDDLPERPVSSGSFYANHPEPPAEEEAEAKPEPETMPEKAVEPKPAAKPKPAVESTLDYATRKHLLKDTECDIGLDQRRTGRTAFGSHYGKYCKPRPWNCYGHTASILTAFAYDIRALLHATAVWNQGKFRLEIPVDLPFPAKDPGSLQALDKFNKEVSWVIRAYSLRICKPGSGRIHHVGGLHFQALDDEFATGQSGVAVHFAGYNPKATKAIEFVPISLEELAGNPLFESIQRAGVYLGSLDEIEADLADFYMSDFHNNQAKWKDSIPSRRFWFAGEWSLNFPQALQQWSHASMAIKEAVRVRSTDGELQIVIDELKDY